METRIMFLIILLLVLWLIFSPQGREYIAKFSQFVTGNTGENTGGATR